MTPDQYQAKFNELWSKGFHPTSFNVQMLAGGQRYAGVWMSGSGGWANQIGMSAADYQKKYNDFNSRGFRIFKIQGYDDGARFGAIWNQ